MNEKYYEPGIRILVRRAMYTAKELGYGEEVVSRLKAAKSEWDIEHILVEARMNCERDDLKEKGEARND